MKPFNHKENMSPEEEYKNRKELIIENNTVYEIDLECIENIQKKKGCRH